MGSYPDNIRPTQRLGIFVSVAARLARVDFPRVPRFFPVALAWTQAARNVRSRTVRPRSTCTHPYRVRRDLRRKAMLRFGTMRELEIRGVLAHVVKELDLRAAARRSAASAVIGTSLLLTAGCSDDDPQTQDDSQTADASTSQDGSTATDGGGSGDIDSGAIAEYMAPAPDAGAAADSGSDLDAGTGMDGGAVAVYSAPAPDAAATDSGADIDSGAVAEYMAPIDAGPVPDYMAQPVDAGAVAIYMAVEAES